MDSRIRINNAHACAPQTLGGIVTLHNVRYASGPALARAHFCIFTRAIDVCVPFSHLGMNGGGGGGSGGLWARALECVIHSCQTQQRQQQRQQRVALHTCGDVSTSTRRQMR